MKGNDKAKEYLNQIRKTDHLINRLLSTVATLRSGLTSQSYELHPDKVLTSGAKIASEETIIKIVDLEAEINQHIDELVNLKRAAYRMIKKISDLNQQNILIARYVQGLKWEAISGDVGHDVRWVYRVHRAGLISFLSVMDSTL